MHGILFIITAYAPNRRIFKNDNMVGKLKI
jgi:hypothetical protein